VTSDTNVAADCNPNSASPVLFHSFVSVGAFFKSGGGLRVLSCRISDTRSGLSLAYATVPIKVLPTMWPLWDDAILVSAAGIMRSSRLGRVVNATRDLTIAASSTLSNSTGDAVTVASALASPVTVISATRAIFENRSLRTTSNGAFTVTLTGSSLVVLRRDQDSEGYFPAFSINNTNASLAGVLCNISAVSDDGAWALLSTPSSEILCGSLTEDCGYVSLMTSNAPTAASLGSKLVCPPFCPAAIGVPIATAQGRLVLGLDPPPAAPFSLPVILPPAPLSSSEGVYYAAACAQTGVWTDPNDGCLSRSEQPRVLWLCIWRRRWLHPVPQRRPVSRGLSTLGACGLLGPK